LRLLTPLPTVSLSNSFLKVLYLFFARLLFLEPWICPAFFHLLSHFFSFRKDCLFALSVFLHVRPTPPCFQQGLSFCVRPRCLLSRVLIQVLLTSFCLWLPGMWDSFLDECKDFLSRHPSLEVRPFGACLFHRPINLPRPPWTQPQGGQASDHGHLNL